MKNLLLIISTGGLSVAGWICLYLKEHQAIHSWPGQYFFAQPLYCATWAIGIKMNTVGVFDYLPTPSPRSVFVRKYCKQKKWDDQNLAIWQIMEIRKQPGWINPKRKSLIGGM